MRKTIVKLRERGFTTLAGVGKRSTFVDIDRKTFRTIQREYDDDLRWDLWTMVRAFRMSIELAEGPKRS